jgi:hypothetical protein
MLLLDNPAYWRYEAQQIRAIASRSNDAATRSELLDIAVRYDLLALRVEAAAEDVIQHRPDDQPR